MRGTTTQRGLGAPHQAERARQMRILRVLDSRPCRRCDQPMVHPSRCPYGPCHHCRLDLGHPAWAPAVFGGDPAGGLDLEHARCNRQAGARLGNRLRGIRRHPDRW